MPTRKGAAPAAPAPPANWRSRVRDVFADLEPEWRNAIRDAVARTLDARKETLDLGKPVPPNAPPGL